MSEIEPSTGTSHTAGGPPGCEPGGESSGSPRSRGGPPVDDPEVGPDGRWSRRTVYPPELEQAEARLIGERRRVTGRGWPLGASPDYLPSDTVGLALSGGGIRSATFCLGVLQSLASKKLLGKIDLLSTVSGGGFIGAFLGRLFVRPWVKTPGHNPLVQVEATLADCSSKPIRWLRDNGRYLSPNGAGDSMLAAAIVLRNLVAVHVVLATLTVGVFLLGALPRALVPGSDDLLGGPGPASPLWWSPWLGLPAVFFVIWLVPVAGAYWLSNVDTTGGLDRWQTVATAALVAVTAAGTGMTLGLDLGRFASQEGSVAMLLAGLAAAEAIMIWLVAVGWISTRSSAGEKASPEDASVGQGFGRTWPALVGFALLAPVVIGTWYLLGVRGAQALGMQGAQARLPAWVPSHPWPLAAAAALVLLVAVMSLNRWLRSRDLTAWRLARCRNVLSRWLMRGLALTLGCLLFAVVDSAGQTVYAVARHLGLRELLANPLALPPLAAIAALLVFAGKLAPMLEKLTGTGRWKLRWQLVAGVVAIVVVFLLLTGMAAVAHGIAWGWQPPAGNPGEILVRRTAQPAAGLAVRVEGTVDTGATTGAVDADRGQVVVSGSASMSVQKGSKDGNEGAGLASHMSNPAIVVGLVAVLFLIIAFGHCIYFLTLSSHLTLYAARLSRAYLGASNPERWKGELKRLTDVAEHDGIGMDDYRPFDAGGPLHLLNLTVNETVAGDSQIEHRDRKGLPMAVGPCGLSVAARFHALWKGVKEGHAADTLNVVPLDFEPGRFHALAGRGAELHRVQSRTLEQWVAASGAAFTTGLGWRTSLGASLLLGLGNVRLGHWWDSHIEPGERAGAVPPHLSHRAGRAFARALPVYAYLFDELLARFHGPERRYWYLSDGGHFENTACYELIRRRVPVIICCDCGADPDYRFDDIANLVRRVRTDFGAEVAFPDRAVLGDSLADILAVRGVGPAEVISRTPRTGGQGDSAQQDDGPAAVHATIAYVTYPSDDPDRPLCASAPNPDAPRTVILFIKPSLTGDEPRDVAQYRATHELFPQEPTTDQFFDEAQWESYRKLGEHIGDRLFGDDDGSWWPGGEHLDIG